jgi:hypothetical protein
LLAAPKSTLDRLHDVENELRGALKTFGLKVGSTTWRTFGREYLEGTDFGCGDGRLCGEGESDSGWQTKEGSHVGSDTLTPGF